MTLVHLRLAPFLVVVARWSTDLDVIYVTSSLKVSLAPVHQCPCSFEKIQINTYKFKKLLKKNLDLGTSVSHNRVKNKPQILCILRYTKITDL